MPLPFATNGTKNTIPEASQIGITPGAASLNDGFPPLTFTPIAAGGVPPSGGDFNGVLNLITQSIRWAHAGGRYAFSSTFAADVNVGGYPAGAVLMSADQQGSWLSLNDNNTDNPDTGPGTKWVPSHAYGGTSITGLAGSNVTLTPAQAMKSKISLAGTLTANVQIIFPAWTRDWTVVNNTTGAFTVTAKTAAGTGVALAFGQQKISGDGTNIVQPPESVAPAVQSQHAMQYGQAVGRLINVQRFTVSGTYTPTPGTTSIIAEGVGGGAGGAGATATSSQTSCGGGGGGGAYAKVRITAVPASASVIIGSGGSAGGTTGGAGGVTSFGSYFSVGGGAGGQASAAVAGQSTAAPGGGSTTISTGGGAALIEQGQGGMGDWGLVWGVGTVGLGGKGGVSFFGGGANGAGTGLSGFGSSSYGAGGGGACNVNTGSGLPGGPGAPGVVIVYEFA
ncbi:hypothetical protein CFB81_16380 [Burkholderia sp. AU28863]|nr:hypothetical protein CFB81_16380 [Burkholderia sp. AU28863]